MRREAARRLEEWREDKRRKEEQEEEQRLSEEIQKRRREKVPILTFAFEKSIVVTTCHQRWSVGTVSTYVCIYSYHVLYSAEISTSTEQ